MAHNLVFTQPGQRMAVVQATIALPPDPERIIKHPAILTQTPTLKPNASAVLKFTAPKAKGIYPYVCTLPGHGLLMYGAMYVGEAMPDLAKDEHVPPMARAKGANSNLHAWPHRRPLMYRIFMPDASPAAIAVALPHGVSYCWDAGTRLRYAWIGGSSIPCPSGVPTAMDWPRSSETNSGPPRKRLPCRSVALYKKWSSKATAKSRTPGISLHT